MKDALGAAALFVGFVLLSTAVAVAIAGVFT